jgi:hypothetical protein
MPMFRCHEKPAWIEGRRAQLGTMGAERQTPSSALPAWRRSRGHGAAAISPTRRATCGT